MIKKDIWHKRITPEGLGINILLAVVSLISFSFFFHHVKNNFAFALFLFSLLFFFVFLTYILLEIGRRLLRFGSKLLNIKNIEIELIIKK